MRCACIQDHHGLVYLNQPLAFWPDLTTVVVSSATDITDIALHPESASMYKNSFAYRMSHLKDRRFTREAYRNLKIQFQKLGR